MRTKSITQTIQVHNNNARRGVSRASVFFFFCVMYKQSIINEAHLNRLEFNLLLFSPSLFGRKVGKGMSEHWTQTSEENMVTGSEMITVERNWFRFFRFSELAKSKNVVFRVRLNFGRKWEQAKTDKLIPWSVCWSEVQKHWASADSEQITKIAIDFYLCVSIKIKMILQFPGKNDIASTIFRHMSECTPELSWEVSFRKAKNTQTHIQQTNKKKLIHHRNEPKK